MNTPDTPPRSKYVAAALTALLFLTLPLFPSFGKTVERIANYGIPIAIGAPVVGGTANNIAVVSSSNTLSQIATANNGVVATNGSGVPSVTGTLPSVVQGNITSTGTVTSGTWNGTAVDLAHGGLNNNNTASAGGIFWSDASKGNILAGTSTANQALLSGSSATPAWSTATYPPTTTANQLLYSSATNTIGGLATGNNGVLITSGAGVPSISSTLPSAVQGNITTVGTVTSGTWTGTSIAVGNGGTGQTTATAAFDALSPLTTQGDVLYYNGTHNVRLGAGSTGQALTAQGASANPTFAYPTNAIFGDGSTGALHVTSGTTTLAADAYYTTLTVDVGCTLKTGGFRVFCKTSATVNGSVNADGMAGGNATTGAVGSGGGNAYSSVFYGEQGPVGGAGGDGGTNAAGAFGVGQAGGLGSAGGAGGAATNAGGVAHPVTAPAAYSGGVPHDTYVLHNIVSPDGQSIYLGGGGGGGGGASAGTAFGGGGGGGAGILALVSPIITGTGTISANGGAGGNGNGTAANAGGGGGGGGGYVLVVTYSSTITPTANGGSGGTGFGTGATGQNGTNGTVVQLLP
jgi:hypothetical protein